MGQRRPIEEQTVDEAAAIAAGWKGCTGDFDPNDPLIADTIALIGERSENDLSDERRCEEERS